MTKLTVLTYNIRGDFWSREATLGLARIVKEREIDVICLQEVCKRFNSHKENSHDILSELKVALGGEYEDFAFLPVQCPTMSAGTAIVYRKSLLVPVGDPYMKHFPLMSARKPYEEWINGYMAPMRRMIMTEGFRMGSRMLIVYCAHLDYFGGDNRRIYQINHMFNLWGDRRNGDEICEVLAGDFNTWMPYKLIGLYRRFGKLRKWLQKKGSIILTR